MHGRLGRVFLSSSGPTIRVPGLILGLASRNLVWRPDARHSAGASRPQHSFGEDSVVLYP